MNRQWIPVDNTVRRTHGHTKCVGYYHFNPIFLKGKTRGLVTFTEITVKNGYDDTDEIFGYFSFFKRRSSTSN